MKVSLSANQLWLTCAVLLIAMFWLVPDLAFAQSAPAFGAGANNLKRDLISFLTPIVGIGIIVLGVMCAFGKINWMWFVGALFGVILIFGHEQIINWVRTSFSV